jgi:hypothetical protein
MVMCFDIHTKKLNHSKKNQHGSSRLQEYISKIEKEIRFWYNS